MNHEAVSALLGQQGIDVTTVREERGQLVLDTSADEAFGLWQRVYALRGESGLHPLLYATPPRLGIDPEDDDHHVGEHEDGLRGPEAILSAASELDLDSWIAREYEGHAVNRHGVWPEGSPAGERVWKPPLGVTELELHLIPCQERIWEIPALFEFGDWNACPAPEIHVAMLTRWADRFGAEPVSYTLDGYALLSSRLPDDREAALRLAIEQYVLCDDILVVAGLPTQTLEALAHQLHGCHLWQFWWD